ncbi:hypothetical protein ACTXT7_001602 [Hymenolepis weldensis]
MAPYLEEILQCPKHVRSNLARDWLLRLLRQKHCLNVGHQSTLNNGSIAKEFVQRLIVADDRLLSHFGGNLHPGDLILRVGEVSTRGLGPDQVARLLRQTAVANYNLGAASADTTSSISSTSTATTSTYMSTAPPVSLLVARPAQGSPSALADVFEKQSQQVRTRQPLGPLW